MSSPPQPSLLWQKQMDRLLVMGNQVFGHTVSYQRPGFDPFDIVGVPDFIDRLEDPNRGQFYSIFFRVVDFDATDLRASIVATFSGAPASGGTLTIDGITYTSQSALDNSVPYQVWRGGNSLAAATNLAQAINATAGYAGTSFSTPTPPHPTCTADSVNDNGDGTVDVLISYKTPGIAGNSIQAVDHMSFVGLSSKVFSGGLPLINDLLTLEGILYRVSDVPQPDQEGGLQVRLEKKAL